ncbi:hypothetical protein K439DRAFT_1640074 [Ramaria rubella]|nr:hypothetical protein K439DRAFT_1640074 [Ramaria rubella]
MAPPHTLIPLLQTHILHRLALATHTQRPTTAPLPPPPASAIPPPLDPQL